MKKVATKNDWKTSSMPEQNETFSFKRYFSNEQMESLKNGNIPQQMEDKWFWYFEDNTLYAHRSWTGFCIYIIEFDTSTWIHKVTVNRFDEQYSCKDVNEDIITLNKLLDWWSQSNYDFYNEWLSETLDNLKKQQEPDFVLRIGDKEYPAVYFHKPEEPNGYLSNWYISAFDLDGITFTSVEQYIMYRKCVTFGDMISANKVLETDDPALQQKIARSAKGYNDTVWKGLRQVVAMRALVEKFAQNPKLLEQLKDTDGCYLVECAKSDRHWACGISLYDEARFDINNWTGSNILGFALMEVRQMLMNYQTSSQDINCFYLEKGDICKLECECIVNAANKSLLGGGGVDGAIHRAAGPELLKECKGLHGCETGEAKITGGYNLKAKYIIHTVGPIYSGAANDAKLLADCYRNSLNLAKDHGVHSIAFPAISTGVYRYPLKEACEIAVNTVREWFTRNEDYGMAVIFSCFDDKTYQQYESLL